MKTRVQKSDEVRRVRISERLRSAARLFGVIVQETAELRRDAIKRYPAFFDV